MVIIIISCTSISWFSLRAKKIIQDYEEFKEEVKEFIDGILLLITEEAGYNSFLLPIKIPKPLVRNAGGFLLITCSFYVRV